MQLHFITMQCTVHHYHSFILLKVKWTWKKLFPYESNRLVDLEIGDLLKFFILKFRENSKKLQRVNEKHHSVSKVNWCLSQSLWKMVRGTELCALFIIDWFFFCFSRHFTSGKYQRLVKWGKTLTGPPFRDDKTKFSGDNQFVS